MRVNVANPSARKTTAGNENQYFLMTSLWDSRKIVPQFQQLITIVQVATCQFADHHWMHAHPPLCQQLIEPLVAMPQMIDPDRGIDKNHIASQPDRRLEIGSSPGSLPPRAARRRALSRSIRAFRPSRSNADFSCTPVNVTARSNNRSSMVRVVRISQVLWHQNSHQFTSNHMRSLNAESHWISAAEDSFHARNWRIG